MSEGSAKRQKTVEKSEEEEQQSEAYDYNGRVLDLLAADVISEHEAARLWISPTEMPNTSNSRSTERWNSAYPPLPAVDNRKTRNQ